MSTDPFFTAQQREVKSRRADFDLQEYLDLLRERWKLLVACALIGLAIGVVHFQITPEMYQATTTIQIERRATNPTTSSSQLWMENWWNMEYYPTQYRLLRSRGLAERVVEGLRLYEDSFFARKGEAAAPPSEAGYSSHDDDATLAAMANRLRGGLSVSDIRNTQLVEITYRSLDPEFAARVANGYADTYIEWGLSERSGTAERGSAFLASEIETLKFEINEKEAQLQELSLNSDAVVIDAEGGSMVSEQLDSLNQSYSDAVRERVRLEARYRELMRSPKEAVADIESGGLVQQLRSEQIAMEREYDTKLETYKPEWPAMVELKSNIDAGRRNLEAVVDDMGDKARKAAYSDYQAALRQERSLQEEMSRLRGVAFNQNADAVEIANLRAEIETRRNNLEQFYQAQSATQAAARFQQTKESNVRVVDRALVPGGPYQPSLKTDLAAGLSFGLLGGILIVVLLHYLDRTVKNVEQAERLLGLPVLAVIADIATKSRGYGYYRASAGKRRSSSARHGTADETSKEIELVPELHPRMPISEAYRSLRAALLMSTAFDLRVVSVTSSESGEGKSSTATNLAVVMAQLGKRVLLVDADLRRPRLHKIFGVSNRGGLVSSLTGGVALARAAQRSDVSHLHLLTSGPIPPNPSELLASQRMNDLIEEMRESYDFVVVDSPPVLAVSDPIHIGAVADGIVFCIAANSTQRDHCLAAKDRLDLADVKILGLVLNRYDAGQKSYRERYYHYYHYYASEDEAADSAA